MAFHPGFVLAAAFIISVILFLVLMTIGKFQNTGYTNVTIGGKTINAELATSLSKQTRGLMFRESLPADGGMLFKFPDEGSHGIWMMNMSIALDILWLDKNKKIVYIEHSAKPCSALAVCPIYNSPKSSMYVLEVNSGFAKRYGIEIGDVAKFG